MPSLYTIMDALQEIQIKTRLLHKLNPSRFPRMSGLMAAIVGHLLDVTFVSPPIAEVNITSDGCVLIRTDEGANHIVGNYTDLIRNWASLLVAAGLTAAERFEAEALFAHKVGYFGRTIA